MIPSDIGHVPSSTEGHLQASDKWFCGENGYLAREGVVIRNPLKDGLGMCTVLLTFFCAAGLIVESV